MVRLKFHNLTGSIHVSYVREISCLKGRLNRRFCTPFVQQQGTPKRYLPIKAKRLRERQPIFEHTLSSLLVGIRIVEQFVRWSTRQDG
jgi:hypothetical protein